MFLNLEWNYMNFLIFVSIAKTINKFSFAVPSVSVSDFSTKNENTVIRTIRKIYVNFLSKFFVNIKNIWCEAYRLSVTVL